MQSRMSSEPLQLHATGPALPWYRQVDRTQWKAFLAREVAEALKGHQAAEAAEVRV